MAEVPPFRIRDDGHGYDTFGLNVEVVEQTLRILMPVYDHWFRVTSYHHENIPRHGPVILASNHSGTLPFDGVMIYIDVALKAHRIARPVADYFVPMLPLVSTFFARVGVVSGTRGNTRALLERGELLMIFPEGTPGIGKPVTQRYQLQNWRVGHVEFAIRHRTPVVPVAVVGAEEQLPQLARLPIKAFGAPYLPIPATPIPLPVRYHILYGEPIVFDGEYEPEQADDPKVLDKAALRVKEQVQALIREGLDVRQGVFR